MTQPTALSDQARCPSTHWFLLLGCELPRGHRDNWHQGRDAANTTIRYRRTIGVTEAYRDGEWQSTDVPTPDGLDWRAAESVLNFAGQRGDADTIAVVDGLTRQNGALLARVRELEAENERLRDVLKRTQALAETDPPTCANCGHLESAHDPDGDRDCNASAARVRSCTCTYYIACYPEPAPGGPTRPV